MERTVSSRPFRVSCPIPADSYGLLLTSRTTIPVLDLKGRVVTVCPAQPNVPDWKTDVNDVLAEFFEDARDAYSFKPGTNRRIADDFKSISFGISYGGGQQRVGRLAHSSHKNYAVVDALRRHPAMKRVANLGNAALQMFAPNIYNLYEWILEGVCERDATLDRNWSKNVFACATVNVGPRTVTAKHVDYLNVPFGWCAITAIGHYNHRLGGHLILWELKKIIEFPPGATILIPSAIIHHSNLAIAEHERRYSITQYTAGGLFRWAECRFQSYKDLKASGGKLSRDGRARWEWGVGMLSYWVDVKQWLGLS
ncbi:hypothetical protein C8Q76DRAFT_634360 [Earliella scabrosa]|nr:hypothetical protein C8Q76DRAFT_634360 [Earliella scabrosa]